MSTFKKLSEKIATYKAAKAQLESHPKRETPAISELLQFINDELYRLYRIQDSI